MKLHPLDWAIVLAYVAFAVGIGVCFARRAGRSVDEFFLSGRTLPWWLAGTSMVATTFASDTPLVVTGWVRDFGIWKNWLWWCFAISGMLTAFLFARWWRRGTVMTKAEFAELRYGGAGARVLRGFLGVMHAGVTNTIVLCWVLLAMAKIVDVLLGIETRLALTLACFIALTYSLLAGFWGVVLTDLVQFAMAMVGAVILAVLGWQAIGGTSGLRDAVTRGEFPVENLQFFPTPAADGIFDAAFWTVPVAAIAVYLGVSWWAAEGVDGGSLAIQRIAASRDEKQGLLAVLWYNVAHFALRPWPWILVALASLIVLPTIEVRSPVAGEVVAVTEASISIAPASAAEPLVVSLTGAAEDWHPRALVEDGDRITADEMIARTDSERAYVVMMARYLPVGLLGLVVASLLAAFMSTIDTHVNLAASFFVNDVYRRFLRPQADPRHYVLVARLASVGVLGAGGILAAQATSISNLFQFFLAFLGGVGPVYVLRWIWWRVRASTEITAMLASATTTVLLTVLDIEWSLGPLSVDGELEPVGRTILVAATSMACALVSLVVTPTPHPLALVPFYQRVRPTGFWGPVRELAGVESEARSWLPVSLGVVGGLALIFGLLFGLGIVLLTGARASVPAFAVAAVGGAAVGWSVRRL